MNAAASATTACRKAPKATWSLKASTHGTSAQRAKWIKAGLASGDPNQRDTFGAGDL
jgi:predicted metalloprotease